MDLNTFQNQIIYLRATHLQHLAEQIQLEEFKTQYNGVILAFNSINGRYTVRLENGSVIYANSISNSGASNIGGSVSVYYPKGETAILNWL